MRLNNFLLFSKSMFLGEGKRGRNFYNKQQQHYYTREMSELILLFHMQDTVQFKGNVSAVHTLPLHS